MTHRSKAPAICDCSRGYLELLVAELERRQAAGDTINVAFLVEARAAIATAPDYFIEHGY